jgi:iron(III) transport system permease protein
VTRWRFAMTAVLMVLIVFPLAMPVLDLARYAHGWSAWDEYHRLLDLAANTILLISGTLALVMPLGVAGAVLLYRTDLPFRGFLRQITLLSLFIPLPLFTSAWQAALGTSGLLPIALWTTPPAGDPDISPSGIAWKPWAQGLDAAIWVHAVAGLPWVVWLVGQGLCWVERDLEEDALLAASPWRVLWAVTLPRCRTAIFAAGLWVALQTATEITITDMMQVRTFAEEVYNQFIRPERDPTSADARELLARAMAVSVPAVLFTAALVVWVARNWERALPPLDRLAPPRFLFSLGWARGLWLFGVLAVVGLLVGIPLISLVWKTGLSGNPEAWSAETTWKHVNLVARAHGRMVVESLVMAVVAGVLTTGLALLCCWLATEARWFHTFLLGLMAVAWAMPGPVIGIGLKDTINVLMDGEEFMSRLLGVTGFAPLRVALYDGPSLAPVVWASLIRFFPCALAILWPVVRLLPIELRDAARVDGARPIDELRFLIVPLTARVCGRAFLAVTVLSLGELAAGRLVETPGSQTFTHEIFIQMHYGVTNNLAALCLILLGLVALGGTLVAVWNRVLAART